MCIDVAVANRSDEPDARSHSWVLGREADGQHPAPALVRGGLWALQEGLPEAHVSVAREDLERLGEKLDSLFSFVY